MKRQLWILLAVAAFAPLFALVTSDAADPAKLEEGWISLFNGKDLTGWKKNEDGKFEVIDGAIKVSGKRAHLFTEKEFKNFEYKRKAGQLKDMKHRSTFHTVTRSRQAASTV